MAAVDRYLISAFDTYESDMAPTGEVEVSAGAVRVVLPMLLRVASPEWQPGPAAVEGVEITARLGPIVACRATREGLAALADDPWVLVIEASRPGARPECHRSVPFVRATAVHENVDLPEKGDRALVAVVDAGIDVLHEAFRDALGRSRLHAVWDQTDPTGPPPTVDGKPAFGTLHTAADLQGYLDAGKVPPGLGRDVDGHGTHVASIAGGRVAGDFAGGVAPEAMLLAVVPDLAVAPWETRSLGYSNSHVAALSYIDAVATELGRPVVVNVSLGMNAGAHDGTSLLEAAFDEFSGGGRRPGRVIVKSAGNERAAEGHSRFELGPANAVEVRWESVRNHPGPDTLELWFPAHSAPSLQVVDPFGESSPWCGADAEVEHWFGSGNRCYLSYTRYHWDNGDSRVQVTVHRGVAGKVANGEWRLVVHADPARSSGPVHAWLERSDQRPVRLLNFPSEECTLSIPGTAHTVITVGSVGAAVPYRVADNSSAGPTRDGRPKPDIAAPGEEITAARGGTTDEVRVMSGTSMAAPHVTGAIALLLSRRAKQPARQLNANQIRAALTGRVQNFDGRFNPLTGYGVLDVEQLLDAFS